MTLTPSLLESLHAFTVPTTCLPSVLDGTPLRAVWQTPARYGISEHPRDGELGELNAVDLGANGGDDSACRSACRLHGQTAG